MSGPINAAGTSTSTWSVVIAPALATTTDQVEVDVPAALIGPDMSGLWRRFPPRGGAVGPMTQLPREALLAKMWAVSQLVDDQGLGAQQRRRLGLKRSVDWLADQHGDTWQQRWIASGADGAAAGPPGPDRRPVATRPT